MSETELTDRQQNILRLVVQEYIRTAQPIIDALTARAQEGIWGYTARPDSYFASIADWQKRRNHWDIDRSLMSFSPGVVQTISAMIQLYTPSCGSVLI